jgi:hypothetical protein
MAIKDAGGFERARTFVHLQDGGGATPVECLEGDCLRQTPIRQARRSSSREACRRPPPFAVGDASGRCTWSRAPSM